MPTPEQIANVFAESRRRMVGTTPTPQRDEPPVRVRPLPPLPDPVQEWREWHDTRDREREANRAKLRRADRERQAEYARAVQTGADTEQRLDALEIRMANVEATIATLSEAVSNAADFTHNAVVRFGDVEAAFKKLNASLDTMRENMKSELAALRDRMSGKETTAAREAAARAEQQNSERHERSQRDAAVTRREISNLNGDVRNTMQLVVREIQRRQH
jgi:uncharacterized coiled-coil protein SlyX